MIRGESGLRRVEQLFQRDLRYEHTFLMFRVGTFLRLVKQLFQRYLRNGHAILIPRDGTCLKRVEQLFQRDLRNGHVIFKICVDTVFVSRDSCFFEVLSIKLL